MGPIYYLLFVALTVAIRNEISNALRHKREPDIFGSVPDCPASQQCRQEMGSLNEACMEYHAAHGISFNCVHNSRGRQCSKLEQTYPETVQLQSCIKAFQDVLNPIETERCKIQAKFDRCIDMPAMSDDDCARIGEPQPPFGNSFQGLISHKVKRAITFNRIQEHLRAKRQTLQIVFGGLVNGPFGYNGTDPCSRSTSDKARECYDLERKAGCQTFGTVMPDFSSPQFQACNRTAAEEHRLLESREAVTVDAARQKHESCMSNVEQQLWVRVLANPNKNLTPDRMDNVGMPPMPPI